MKLLHVRHATSILTYEGVRILIDPVFAGKETSPAFPMTPNRRKNPLVDLSTPMNQLLDIDLVLATHLHIDHFDQDAMDKLDKNLDLICQSEDVKTLQSKGFLHVIPVKDNLVYQNITLTRVNAQHGTGPIGQSCAPASGYILQSKNEPTVYITGDTIYNNSVKTNIYTYQPQIMIMNAGSPKFLFSDRIVMNIMDIENTLRVNPALCFVIVHLDTYNHCIETREDIHEYFSTSKLQELGVSHFYVPSDNETLDERILV